MLEQNIQFLQQLLWTEFQIDYKLCNNKNFKPRNLTCNEASSTKSLIALLNVVAQLLTCWPPLDKPVNSYAKKAEVSSLFIDLYTRELRNEGDI